MKLTLDDLAFISSEQLFIKFSLDEREKVWQQTHGQSYSNTAAQWNAYLNCLCLNTFLTYLKTEIDLPDPPQVWQNWAELPSFWDVVNGTAIELGQTRLVLIPSEENNCIEFTVPREWVDIPNWAGNYYLAVQLNLEECWLRVCGYATHQQLRDEGRYDRMNETYSVDTEDLIEDLSVMWMVKELYPSRKLKVKALPILSLKEVEELLEKLEQRTPYLPRLNVPFVKWTALLANDKWRQELYARRVKVSVKQPVQLSKWFQQIFEVSWQTVEEVLDSLAAPEANLAYRSGSSASDISPTSPKAIPTLVELLKTNQNKSTRKRVADLLGDIAHGNSEAIAALNDLVRHAPDRDTRRQAAVSLGKINPGNPHAGVRRARIIDLGIRIGGHPVVLTVTLMPETNNKTNIHLRVDAVGNQTYLPPNLQLMVLDEEGQIFQQKQSRSIDNAIQLEFRGASGDGFRVKVALGDASVSEDFVL